VRFIKHDPRDLNRLDSAIQKCEREMLNLRAKIAPTQQKLKSLAELRSELGAKRADLKRKMSRTVIYGPEDCSTGLVLPRDPKLPLPHRCSFYWEQRWMLPLVSFDRCSMGGSVESCGLYFCKKHAIILKLIEGVNKGRNTGKVRRIEGGL